MDTGVSFPQQLTTRWSDFDRRPAKMRYPWQREESFEERRNRAWSLPRQYRRAWAQHLSDVMDADKGNASYYAYDFWTTAPWGESFDQIALCLQRACEYATSAVFPDLTGISRNRRPLTLCTGAVMLPAQAENGIPHVHGFIRIPELAEARGQNSMCVQKDGSVAAIIAPTALGHVMRYMRAEALDYYASIHVAHEDGEAIDVASHPRRRQRKLEYLIDNAPEVRSWDRVEFMPWRLWRRVLKIEHPFHRTVYVPPPKTHEPKPTRPNPRMLFAEEARARSGSTGSHIEDQFAQVRRYLSSLK
jgi:hypothetical protein